MTDQTPVELAASVYQTEACARTFKEDLEAHLLNGYVFSTPDYFVMGRAVDSRAGYELITNPWVTFRREECDAWLVYLFGGALSTILPPFPYALPKVGFERKNRIRYYRFEFLHRHLSFHS